MRISSLLLSVTAIASLSACGDKKKATASLDMTLKSLSTATTMNFEALEAFSPIHVLSGFPFGGSAVGTGGLESYKLYISGIQMCKTLTTSGTAYNNPGDCVTLYNNSGDNYDTFLFDSATAAGSDKYIDMLSQTDRAKLTQTVGVTAGDYNYGIISWYRPIKVKATVPLTNGNTLYSKTCTATDCPVGTTGAAEDAVYDSNNGGTWFKFLKTFTVAEGDSVAVDLAFDLDQRVVGGDGISNGFAKTATGCTATTSGYCGIYAPQIRLNPVPRKTTEESKVETYIMSGGNAEWNIKVDLYYNGADTDKAVLAADIYPVVTTATNSSVAAGVFLTEIAVADGVTTFKNYDGTVQLTNFTRNAAGGTATFTCPTGATLAGCTAGSTLTLTYAAPTVKTLQN